MATKKKKKRAAKARRFKDEATLARRYRAKKKRAGRAKVSKFARKSNPPRYHRWKGDKRTKTRTCGHCALKREFVEGPMGGMQVRYSRGKKVLAEGHRHTPCPPCPKAARA